MIQSLRIKNLGLIDNLEIEFNTGFTSITGETGAGKSMILQAIELLSGAPADEAMIRSGADTCELECILISNAPDLTAKWPELAQDEGQWALYRKISRSKPSINRVNMQAVPLKILKQVAAALVSLIGQDDPYEVFNSDYLRRMLDQAAGHSTHSWLSEYQTVFQEFTALQTQHAALLAKIQISPQQKEFLEFQIQDIRSQQFQNGEEDTLQTTKKRLRHLGEFTSAFNQTRQAVATTRQTYAKALEGLDKLSRIDNRFASLIQAAHALEAELQDIESRLQQSAPDPIEETPENLNRIETRLDQIFTYKSKYKVHTLSELETLKHTLENNLNMIHTSAEAFTKLETAIQKSRDKLVPLAQKLHEVRQTAAQKLEKVIQAHLAELELEKAVIHIKVRWDPEDLTKTGGDTLTLTGSLNPNEPLKPLEKVASGGERSRLMLGLKAALFENLPVQTLLFDEIETGVGGLTANKMGQKLQTLSRQAQVICITHLAQIAQFADHLIQITKTLTAESTSVRCRYIPSEERIQEFERLIGGTRILTLLTKEDKKSKTAKRYP